MRDEHGKVFAQAVVPWIATGVKWDSFSAVPQEIVDGGETVVSLGRYSGVYKATGAKVDAQFVHVFKFKDGKIAGFQQYTDTAQFKDAVSRRAAA